MGTLASRLRLLGITIVALCGLSFLTGAFAPAAGAQASPCARNGCIDVVAVNGLIDQIEADFIIDTLDGARGADGVVGVVLQFDSGGTAVDDDRLDEVAAAITGADVPVSVWIGPSGSEALGGAVELVQVADSSGIAPGSRIGDAGPQRLSTSEFGELLTGEAAVARTEVLSGQEAVDAGVVGRFSPTVGDHIVNLDGVKTETRTEDGERRQIPVTTVRFSKLPLFTQLFHTVASPSVAYLLLAVGLGLLLFEFFTAGVGVAGVVGAVCSVLAAYGIAELPHNTWAVVLVLASMVAFAIDVQTGIPRLWTIFGMVGFVVGSVFLFTEFRPTWIASGGRAHRHRHHDVLGHAGHGADPLRHPDHRPGVDDRGDGRRGVRRWTRRARSGCGRRCGGPGPTGPPRSRWGTRSAWSPSTVWCWRSSPRRVGPSTTGRCATAVAEVPTPRPATPTARVPTTPASCS